MVKRYDMREFDHSIERYEDGSLVSYDDYAALAERCERLEEALQNILSEHANDNHRPKAFYIAAEAVKGSDS